MCDRTADRGPRPGSSLGVKWLLPNTTHKLASEEPQEHCPSQESPHVKACEQNHSKKMWRQVGPHCTWAKHIWNLRHQKILWKDAQELLYLCFYSNEKLIASCLSQHTLVLKLHRNHLGDSLELSFSYCSDSHEIQVPTCTPFKGKCS